MGTIIEYANIEVHEIRKLQALKYGIGIAFKRGRSEPIGEEERTMPSQSHAGDPRCICGSPEAAKERDLCEPCSPGIAGREEQDNAIPTTL